MTVRALHTSNDLARELVQHHIKARLTAVMVVVVVVAVSIKVAYLAFVPQSFLKERVYTLYLVLPTCWFSQSSPSFLVS